MRIDTFYNALQVLYCTNVQDPSIFLSQSDLRAFAREVPREITPESFSERHLVPALEELFARGLIEVVRHPENYGVKLLYRINPAAKKEVGNMMELLLKTRSGKKRGVEKNEKYWNNPA